MDGRRRSAGSPAPVRRRPGRRKRCRVVVVGAGTAGILAAIRLRQAGYEDLVVYEKAHAIGGTWRDNTYPGVACDVPAYLYSYSFAPNPDWSHTFAPGPEIEAYLERVVADAGVGNCLQLGVEVTRMEHDGDRWRVSLADGREDVGDLVVAATGVLHHPNVPDLPGLGTFAGACFHSSRWDHGTELDGARVAVVGTGSSGVQIVAALAGQVAKLTVLQRTAQWVLPIDNPAVPPEERERLRADPAALAALRQQFDATFTEHFANAVVDADSPQAHQLQALCQDNLERSVADPVLRQRLRPDYRAACKRLVMSAGFYPAVQHPATELVTDPIAGVEPGGVRTADGRLHELDVLVLATGFRTDRFLRPMVVVGAGGRKLDEVWDPSPVAYLSMSVPGFPNLFMLNGPNGPVGNFSLIEVAELQVGYLMRLLQAADPATTGICATEAAAQRFEADRVEATKRTVWVTGCRSWYLDARGVPAAWPWSFDRFRQVMERPRMEDYELAPR